MKLHIRMGPQKLEIEQMAKAMISLLSTPWLAFGASECEGKANVYYNNQVSMNHKHNSCFCANQ